MGNDLGNTNAPARPVHLQVCNDRRAFLWAVLAEGLAAPAIATAEYSPVRRSGKVDGQQQRLVHVNFVLQSAGRR